MVTFPGGVTLITPGDQTLSVTDTVSGITGGTIVTVTAGGDAGNPAGRSRKWTTFDDRLVAAAADAAHHRPAVGLIDLALMDGGAWLPFA